MVDVSSAMCDPHPTLEGLWGFVLHGIEIPGNKETLGEANSPARIVSACCFVTLRVAVSRLVPGILIDRVGQTRGEGCHCGAQAGAPDGA